MAMICDLLNVQVMWYFVGIFLPSLNVIFASSFTSYRAFCVWALWSPWSWPMHFLAWVTSHDGTEDGGIVVRDERRLELSHNKPHHVEHRFTARAWCHMIGFCIQDDD